MVVDFHLHSTASDGTESPASVARMAGSFAAAAVTDHDNCDGVREFMESARGAPVRPVSGIELSIEPGEGFDRFHLLGLGVDCRDSRLKALLGRIIDGRNGRNRRILGNFRDRGIVIEEEDLKAYARGDILARPHFARYLVDRGFAPDVKSAFEKYLLPDSPPESVCYEERWHPSQEEVFSAVHAAGGLCIMAHPKYWRDCWRHTGCDFAAAKRELAVLKEKGLDGVEALYQANSEEENVEFTRMASELGLLKSAGSDFHGANKPSIRPGMQVTEKFIAPLLERIW